MSQDGPAPRRDGQPDSLGPPLGARAALRRIPSPRRESRGYQGPWLGDGDPRYAGEVALRHGRPVWGRWKDGAGQWWEWRLVG